MKILIHFHSGTGNAKRVALAFEQNFCNAGHEVFLHNIEDKETVIHWESFDFQMITYPIYGFNTPQFVVKYFKSLCPLVKPLPTYIVMESGEWLKLNNAAYKHLNRFLKRKKMILRGELHYLMPYNMIFRHTDEMAYRMDQTMQSLAKLDAHRMLALETFHLETIPFGTLISTVVRIQYLGAKINGVFYHVDKKKCIDCRLCVNQCPVKNISYDEKKQKLVFGPHCLMCQRCSYQCPKDAIFTGLFNSWKVTPKYNYQKPTHSEENKHPNYCKHSYAKYFSWSEERILKGK